ncbi:MAG TPA: carboxypeptidase-like regulatory domain-containing protein [Bryobacteraceae bacterium]|nr:carboxypeptidase-like regulatory domain-containing protein [Bryobacteraceae bacterium]
MQSFRLVLGLLLATGTVASAQTVGEITGEIRDQSGANAPNASVTATNVATNVARSTVTNNAGIYSFPDMTPGTYQVKVTAPGFETVIKTNIELQVQQTARIDFTLAVGQATQTIEVNASSELLTTENATVGTVIEQKRITDLPLNGRNFFSLVALSPNVTFGFTPAAQAAGREGGSRSTVTMSLSGSRATWSNYTLDGITNTDVNFNLYIVLPSVEALQEFKVQSGVYPAEFGREAGQVNVSTRPGTNQYHGTAFEFLRNDALDAKPYDFLNTHPAKSPYRQNQYGYTLGGPIRIPKIFNGRNRLFFMSNFEGFKSRTTRVASATTLTQAMRNGDFSVVTTPLQDPLTRIGSAPNVTSNPFPGNQIPASRFDKNSLLLMSRFDPLPNVAAANSNSLPLNNYQYLAKTPVDKNQITERIDFSESSRSQWFGRYSWTDELTVMPGLTTDGQTLYTRASQWVLSNTRVLSPTRVNEARFGYNSLYNVIGQQLANVEDVDAEIGVPLKISDPGSWGVPNISLSNNLTSPGNPTSSPFAIDDKVYQGVDNFSWVIGKHSLRFGGEYRYNKYPQIGNEFPRGQFFFTGAFTSNANTQSGGYSGADWLLGSIQRVDMAVALASDDFRNHEWAAYIDDTWKVTPHLTVTAGLRWEVAQPMFDASGHEVGIELQQSLPSIANVPDLSKHPVYERVGTGDFYQGINFRYVPAGGSSAPPLQVARDGRYGDRLISTNYKDFAPRLGIAFSPSDKWSFRAGIGIFFSQESKNSIFDLNRGLGGRTTILPDTTKIPTTNYTNFIDAAALPVNVTTGLTWGANPTLPTTYTVQYVLNVQRALGRSTTLEVGYTGSESRHVDNLTNENAPIPGITAFATRAPYPEFAGIQYLRAEGIGNYNSLGVKLSQRFGRNLTTLFSYTWSKALDDGSAIRGVANDFAPENMRCRACEYGISSFNIPQHFVASVLYTLPFGKGQRFLNYGGVVNQVAGGWQVSTIATLQSGLPIDTTSWDSAGTSFNPNSNRINCLTSNAVLPDPNANAYLNPAAFANTVAGQYGSCARNNLISPKQVNFDFSAIKSFRITERQALEFRTEMFNAPNHVEWGSPSASWGSSNVAPPNSFGQIRSTAASMRQIQFALKYNF